MSDDKGDTMDNLGPIIKPFTVVPPIELEGVRQRVAHGIFLGGTYTDAHREFVIAHRDRAFLLALVDELQSKVAPK